MLTVLESITLSTEYLEKRGIESPRINAELLLADILKCKRLDLYLKFDQPLNENEKTTYRDYISRRGKFEPLQYIIGNVEFYGEVFEVTTDVLIPRQETEILVETAISKLSGKNNLRILDVGTGTGILPILLAKNLDVSEIVAIDKSEKAIEVAKKNIETHELNEKIKLSKFDLFQLKKEMISNKFDVVISNPPYVSDEEYQNLQKEITNFEPEMAVTDNNNGYTFYKFLTDNSGMLLNSGGIMMFELGKDQDSTVKEFMINNKFENIELIKDYLEINRVIYGEKI